MGMSFKGFGRGVGKETVEHDERDEAYGGGKDARGEPDRFGAFSCLGE